MGEKSEKLLNFLVQQYEDAVYRYYLVKFDMPDCESTQFWAVRKHDIKSAIGNVLFFAYLEMYGDEGDAMVRTVLEDAKCDAWGMFVDAMIGKYNIPTSTDTSNWKGIHRYSPDNLYDFFEALDNFRKGKTESDGE